MLVCLDQASGGPANNGTNFGNDCRSRYPNQANQVFQGSQRSSDEDETSFDEEDSDEEALGHVAKYARAHRSVVVSEYDLEEVDTEFTNEELDLNSLDIFTHDLQKAAKGAFDRILGTNDHNLTMTPIVGHSDDEHNIVLALHSTEQHFHSSVDAFTGVKFKEIPLVAMDPDKKKTLDENISKVLTACGLLTTKFHTPNWVMFTAARVFD
ncbi:hypothetical protein IV203_023199 [Nitzschia inconspicua]|uniref:Uncharacterized protein n=1 Tax=Nitzschia inconspicua TaxID=303405 RepID=A0A9K3PBE0_9STRA|nr:hypothetical protein IV203_023199 [Nitzschia inconspicua]